MIIKHVTYISILYRTKLAALWAFGEIQRFGPFIFRKIYLLNFIFKFAFVVDIFIVQIN